VPPPQHLAADVTTPGLEEDGARTLAERMAFAANALPVLMAYVDPATRYVWVNDGYSRWFGRPREEIIGRHVSDVLGDKAWAGVRPHMTRALSGEEVIFENSVFQASGVREVRASYVPDRDSSGNVRGLAVLVVDITETRKAETALRRSERMLEQSQVAAQVGSWEATFDEELLEVPGSALWSPEMYRIFGLKPSAPASQAAFYRHVHPDDRAELQAGFALAIRRGEPLDTEYRVVRPDGSVRVIHGWRHFERLDDGRMTRAVGTCQDITDLREIDREVRRAREQLQVVVDSTPSFIARCDRDNKLVWANKSFAARLGKEPEALVGVRFIDLVGEPAFRVFEPFAARVLAGESVEAELEVPDLAGPRVVHMVAAPTRDAGGIPDGCVSVLTDVTDWRRLERERERALNELHEVDRRKDEFMAMLSHELRNPLMPILTSARLLERSVDGEARHDLDVIVRQVKHLVRLVDDLLDVSRVARGHVTLSVAPLEAATVVARAAEATAGLFAERGHRLEISVPSEGLTVEGDEVRLTQVFDNLLSNAARYTPPGGVVSVTGVREEGSVVLRVRDTGVGIEPGLLPDIFDALVQGQRGPDRAEGGLGIGLSLVRSLTELHGGTVTAHSDGPGLGSEFAVRLPAAAAIQNHATEPTAPIGAVLDAPKNNARVLLVDDHPDVVQGISRLLSSVGYDVHSARDPLEAIDLAETLRPEIAILDIGLPGMDGYALARELHSRLGNSPPILIALSGYSQTADRQRSAAAGFALHLVKPIDVDELVGVLGKLGPNRPTNPAQY
jgi:PAS domain S-box-containing protein